MSRIPLKAVLRELNRRGDIRFASDEKQLIDKALADYYDKANKYLSRAFFIIGDIGMYLKKSKDPDIKKIGEEWYGNYQKGIVWRRFFHNSVHDLEMLKRKSTK